MARYGCTVCGWVYDEELGDEELGIEPGTLLEELPADFTCPECGESIERFEIAD